MLPSRQPRTPARVVAWRLLRCRQRQGALLGWRALVLTGVLIVVAACRQPPPQALAPSPLCVLKVPARLAHQSPDELPAKLWLALLFKDSRAGIDADAVDCSGEPIGWADLPQHCTEQEPRGETERPPDELARAPVEPVLVRHAEQDYWFAWAPFRQLDNGMREGPLAIARLHQGQLEARAIGTLRAFADKTRLQIRQLGREHILVAEGESCSAPTDCTRGTRLMWLDRQRFRARPIRSAVARTCLGPAWFPHTQRIEQRLGTHWSRTSERSTVLAFEASRISLQEHIVVRDRDLERPALPPRLFRDAQARLTLMLEAGELLSEGGSLWPALHAEEGSPEPGRVIAP